MRVIAGRYRGRRLQTLPGTQTRPTAQRVKEAVFSSLSDRVHGAAVLDLFAGSGQLGIEALSRGAKRAVFVDSSAAAAKIIKENLEKIGAGDEAELAKTGFDAFLRSRAGQNERFDIIFIDPPFKSSLWKQAAELINKTRALAPGGILVLECDAANPEEDSLEGFSCYKSSKYGGVMIKYYKGEGV